MTVMIEMEWPEKMLRANLKSQLKTCIATVTFEKQDKSIRVMRCTLMSEHLPEMKEADEKKKKKENEDVLAVWDLDQGGWRSFRIDSIKGISIHAV